jgi:hypothetical protein
MPTVPPPKEEELAAINRAVVEKRTAIPQKDIRVQSVKPPRSAGSLEKEMCEHEEEQIREIASLQAEIDELSGNRHWVEM